MATRTSRLELRADPERERRIRFAAELSHQSVSAFVLDSRWGLDQGFGHYFDDFELGRWAERGDVSEADEDLLADVLEEAPEREAVEADVVGDVQVAEPALPLRELEAAAGKSIAETSQGDTAT